MVLSLDLFLADETTPLRGGGACLRPLVPWPIGAFAGPIGALGETLFPHSQRWLRDNSSTGSYALFPFISNGCFRRTKLPRRGDRSSSPVRRIDYESCFLRRGYEPTCAGQAAKNKPFRRTGMRLSGHHVRAIKTERSEAHGVTTATPRAMRIPFAPPLAMSLQLSKAPPQRCCQGIITAPQKKSRNTSPGLLSLLGLFPPAERPDIARVIGASLAPPVASCLP